MAQVVQRHLFKNLLIKTSQKPMYASYILKNSTKKLLLISMKKYLFKKIQSFEILNFKQFFHLKCYFIKSVNEFHPT